MKSKSVTEEALDFQKTLRIFRTCSYELVSKSSEGAAREWSTVVSISIPPPSFKLVLLSSPRSPLSKTPKKVFFNPIKYI